MKQHLVTHIVTSSTLVIVLVLGGISAATGHLQFVTPAWMLQEQSHIARTSPVARIFSSSVAENMKKVFVVGGEVGNPETLQAILLHETRGGQTEPVGNKNSLVGKRSYGLMQVQVVAARSILKRNPTVYSMYFQDRIYNNVTDEEIIALLLTNDEANIRIAAYHFKLYLQLSSGNWERAVAAYNVGIGAVTNIPVPAEFSYVIKIKQTLDTDVRVFNRKNNLRLTPHY